MKGEVLQKVSGEGRKGNPIAMCGKTKKSIIIMIKGLIGEIYRTLKNGEKLKKLQRKVYKGIEYYPISSYICV